MLNVKNLNKSFGALHAVRDVSLNISGGARHALIGPNGAGKTTLFDLLSGEVFPDSGTIEFAGQDCTGDTSDIRARAGIGRSFQQNSLFGGWTVGQNIVTALLISQNYGQQWLAPLSSAFELEAQAKDLAERIGLGEYIDVLVDQLAYGLQRQLELGLALATNPKLLLLDEPTAGMSPSETKFMVSLINSLPAALTVVIVEHDMDVVFKIADEITVLDAGSILFKGSSNEVRQSSIVQARYLGPYFDDDGITSRSFPGDARTSES